MPHSTRPGMAGRLLPLLLLLAICSSVAAGAGNHPAALSAPPTATPSPAAGSKHTGTPDYAWQPANHARTAPQGVDDPVLCGGGQDGSFETESASFVTVQSCYLNLATPGYVLLLATSSVGVSNTGPAETRLRLAIDGVSQPNTDRWINVYTDTGDGTDKSASVSLLAPLTAGGHEFALVAARHSGTGKVRLLDPTLQVLVIPEAAVELRSCGQASDTQINVPDATTQVLQSCTLNLPVSGRVLVRGDASVVKAPNGVAEARFRVGVDTTEGEFGSDRFVNTYADSGDGADENVATSLSTVVTAGAHTFSFVAARATGAGGVIVHDPSLVVLYIRSGAPNIIACGSYAHTDYNNASTEYMAIRSCNITLPRNGRALIIGDASVGLAAPPDANAYEGRFRLGVDAPGSLAGTDRWVNVTTDSGDGTDRGMADSVVVPLSAGQHVFSLAGARFGGTGTVRVFAASINVIAFMDDPEPMPTATAVPSATTLPTDVPPTMTTLPTDVPPTATVEPPASILYLPLIAR